MKIMLTTMLVLVLFGQNVRGIRAALDFTYTASDGNISKTVTCDFCGHAYSDVIRLETLNVNSGENTVSVFFRDLTDERSKNYSSLISPQKAIESDESVFYIDAFQKAKVRAGQTVQLKNTRYTFKLEDAFGRGCPKGYQC